MSLGTRDLNPFTHAPGRYRLHIVGEATVAVRHCLLALPGVAKADLRRVVSHYQALSQCDGYIRRLPGVVREAADDTAGAAKMIADTGCRRGLRWVDRLEHEGLETLPPLAAALLLRHGPQARTWRC